MKNLFVEIADNYPKREKGLMYRKSLPKNAGMLFKFPHASNLGFWMKNTYVPLDMAFLDDNGRILQIEEGIPLSTRPVKSNDECRHVLEVNRGWFKENGIKVGDLVAGHGISRSKRMAQINLDPNAMPPIDVPQPNQQQPQSQPNPDVILNMSVKDKLKKADIEGRDLMVIYQTKGGITLPPKNISPPFHFEPNEEGRHDAVVKVWDNQDAGWKSFLVDNILSLEEAEKVEKKEEGIPQVK
jgi:uncharacterized protein